MTKKYNTLKGGVVVPIITPVDENEKLDSKALIKQIRRCIDAGVDGIFAGGSAGMGPLLTDFVWQDLMETAAEEIDNQVVLMGGIVAESTGKALEKIRILEKLKFSAIVVTPTYYININTHEEMMTHFSACRQATDMRMIAYNIPGCTSSTIPLETIEKLAEKKWIDLVKESSGNKSYFKSILEICKNTDVGVMQGNEIDIDWSLLLGAAGIVPVCANYDPGLFVKVYQSALKKDYDKTQSLQKEINTVRKILSVHTHNWIAGIMYAVHTLGIGSGKPVRPLQDLPKKQKETIDKLSLEYTCSA